MSGKSDSGQKGFAEGFWSKDGVKDIFLEEQREYIFNEDYFRKILVPFMGLRKDSIILDVGCGLGFIGMRLAEFMPRGKVIGLDLNPDLIEEAEKRSRGAKIGNLEFRVGDACALPFGDNSFDLSICQTLLMHLKDPSKCVAEMRRVAKKGGRVVAIEPDFASLSLFDSAYETMDLSLDDRCKMWRWERIMSAGKKKLGKGDNDIGLRIPHLFFTSGLRLLDVRCLDKVFYLVPPYEGHELELKHLLLPPEKMIETLDLKSDFVSGGGTEEEWLEYLRLAEKLFEVTAKQVENKTYISSMFQAATVTIAEKI